MNTHLKSVLGAVATLLLIVAGSNASFAQVIRVEKDLPANMVSPVPTYVTFDLYDSITSATPVATQTFARGQWWADYNFSRFSTGPESMVRLKADFTNLTTLTGIVELWVDIKLDGVVKGSRERLKREYWALFSEQAVEATHAQVADYTPYADTLDGMDSSEFLTGAHTHSGSDITSGTVAAARIASTIARDNEIMPAVLAGDGSGSTLDADTLDGMESSAFLTGAHTHSGSDITTGTVADARIAFTIARDAEIMGEVLAGDGPGSGLNADMVDGTHASGFVTQAEYDALLARVEALEAKLAYLTVQSGTINGLSGPHIIITGANVHIRSGSGQTSDGGSPVGRGNLIIGYNEQLSVPVVGRGGSHNLVVGPMHEYSSYGGLVAGRQNTVSGGYTSVSGGYDNTASNTYASVSGGQGNTANAYAADVSGGFNNTAYGQYASVSGGTGNVAGGDYASISGGSGNSANDYYSSVSGGHNNTASGSYASVSGGNANIASGESASISGGSGGTANQLYSSISGGYNNTASSSYASVSGGHSNEASGFVSSVSGGSGNNADGYYSSISGGSSNDATGYYSSVSGGFDDTASGEYDWRAGDCYFCTY